MDGKATPSPGLLVAVVGPSGAGKDTLIAAVARHFSGRGDIHIVRRVITRPAEAGGEDHEPATENGFASLRDEGAFACHWRAHGLSYGIPSEAKRWVERGHLVIANGSRSALPFFARAFPRLVVLNITARPEVLAERLASRGRESREDILARLSRSSLEVAGDFDVKTIDNSGALEDAEAAIIALVERLLGENAQAS
jgi:ribose 1,5-bisphosphokinase